MRSRTGWLLQRLATAFEAGLSRDVGHLGVGSAGAGPGSLAQLAWNHSNHRQPLPFAIRQPCFASLLRQGHHQPGTTIQMARCPHGMQLQLMRGMAQQKTRAAWTNTVPVTMQSLIIAMMVGAAGITIVKSYKDEKLQKVMTQSQQVVGKAAVGGPFELIDYNGKPFSSQDLKGEFAVLYFGFTHCPDICPDEMEKVAEAVSQVEKQAGVFVVPVFISVDPERDTPARIKNYVKEFHPKMLGLTGDLEDIKKTSKAYRVYYSKTGEAGAKDYLVDHSIIHYLIDPAGEFVTFYAKNYTAEQMTSSMIEHIANWKASHPDYHPGLTIKIPEKPTTA